MRHSDVREIVSEWICNRTLEELVILKVLAEDGFTDEQIKLATTQKVSRAVYPGSELKTASWIKENSAIRELPRIVKRSPKTNCMKVHCGFIAKKNSWSNIFHIKPKDSSTLATR
jgi:hypothetical protein